jgi:hypothetical protein
MESVARRCVWFKSPEQALAQPTHLIAHVLTYGMPSDVKALRRHMSDEALARAVDDAPPGVFDGRSWAYWRLMLDLPPKPLPVRHLP